MPRSTCIHAVTTVDNRPVGRNLSGGFFSLIHVGTHTNCFKLKVYTTIGLLIGVST